MIRIHSLHDITVYARNSFQALSNPNVQGLNRSMWYPRDPASCSGKDLTWMSEQKTAW
jgi:hypothetical protein